MKTLWIRLQRWNNQRAVVCRQCGTVRRIRRPLAPVAAARHVIANDGHTVKVRRFG